MSQPAPARNGMLSFWRTQLDELDSHRSTPELPKECDVLIIGAGYSGAATAYHLLEGNPFPPSMVMLEARQACSGATGRNGGHIKPDLYNTCSSLAPVYGLEAAVEMAKFEMDQVKAVKAVIEKENIDCDFSLTRSVDPLLNEEHCKKVKAAYDKLREAGAINVQDVHFTPKENAERVSGVKGAKGCFSFTAGHLWPYKLVMHLLRLVVSRGVNLQTYTPVVSVSDEPDPVTGAWTVTTESRGSIKAKKVIFATNAYTAGLAPAYAQKIIPVRGICSRIVTPKGKNSPHLPNTYGLRWSGWEYDYLIPRMDGSIVVGGARRRFYSDPKKWYNTTDDSQLMESAKSYFDGYMQRHFRGWEDSGAYTDQVWTGILGYTTDSLPHVGAVPSKPGQFIMAGFNGHGMCHIFLTAKGIASMILDGKPFETTGIPRLFKTTPERLNSRRNKILESVPTREELMAKL
ncbi:FAD dependent oxidoreductase [Xylona heveae TC161]|uniref:FAD dependent oxidoreductase n=1 Tax=Xylona heveae (strain CBS 132557 / TC161) TaxID=1328760 RepID=A0A165J6H6_XYLHT|nr:FAD dependent oxidoreductase [Xylona heveae TC161]KZF25800.1 FAD dependent oxidoreductase [Xylona heveae TC161]